MQRVYQIRWNNYDRGALSSWSLGGQEHWYKAARRYDAILNNMSRQIWTQLEPGTALSECKQLEFLQPDSRS